MGRELCETFIANRNESMAMTVTITHSMGVNSPCKRDTLPAYKILMFQPVLFIMLMPKYAS